VLLDAARARFELADQDAVADDVVWYSITARRKPTICSLNSLRSDKI
jgi:hypothetical protein